MSLKIQSEIPLAPMTSWRVGGPAEFLAEPVSMDELKEAMNWARANSHEITVLSGGTNVLVSDNGVRGLVIALHKLSGAQTRESVHADGRTYLEIGCLAGTSKSELLKIFLKYKLAPALFLAGIPGDVGGGVAMNAGIGEMWTPREFVELVEWIEVLRFSKSASSGEPQLVRIAAHDLQWSYRHCNGWQPGIIARVGLAWPLEPQDDILARVRSANQVRASKQPLDQPSCGSVFINPAGAKSGQLIEQLGLKGFTIGGAKVSEKHANFIVNMGFATACDIHSVILEVQRRARAERGVELKTEVVYLGNWD
jgi:UDP-N-acetylmuramate dehydrogenase